MEENTRKIESGTPRPGSQYHIEITPDGPYLVYGKPSLQQEFLVLNEEKIPWEYARGHVYSTDQEPTALCRCGHSGNHPYCDGSHLKADWDPTLTADNIPLLENAALYDGPTVQLADNIKYCAHARICMAKGTVWDLTEQSDDLQARDLAVHESMYCPSGRLKLWDKQEESYFEPPLKPALSLIEDPQAKCSGPIWVKGGIPMNSTDGIHYEQRNRVTLCRCGASRNKPFCDGTHLQTHFNDQLPLLTEEEESMSRENSQTTTSGKDAGTA